MLENYKCNDCNECTVFSKPHGKDFPNSIKCLYCGSKNTRRVYSCKYINIPAGKCGNAKNGYTSRKD